MEDTDDIRIMTCNEDRGIAVAWIMSNEHRDARAAKSNLTLTRPLGPKRKMGGGLGSAAQKSLQKSEEGVQSTFNVCSLLVRCSAIRYQTYLGTWLG